MMAAGAAGAKAAKTVNGVMRTPLGHVSTDIGPVHVEGNVTPWGVVAGVLVLSTAGVYYKYSKEYGKEQAKRALAYTIPRIMHTYEVTAQKMIQEYGKAPIKEKPAVLQRMAALNKSFNTYAKWVLGKLEYTGSMEGLTPWMVTAKANEVLAAKKPQFDPPNIAEAFGSAVGDIVRESIGGYLNSFFGSDKNGKTVAGWHYGSAKGYAADWKKILGL